MLGAEDYAAIISQIEEWADREVIYSDDRCLNHFQYYHPDIFQFSDDL